MKKFWILPFSLLLLSSCMDVHRNKESVLDGISHVEDSIHYLIDTLLRLCEQLDIHKRAFVDIGDCKLYCETEGRGTPLVVINGGPGGTHHYFHPWFRMASSFCRVVYYDQRGCGQSDFVSGPDGYSFRQAVDDLDRLREALGYEQWIVCGYSYGGALAQFYTATHPDRVLGMVLISSSPVMSNPAINGSRQGQYISEAEQEMIRKAYGLYREGKLDVHQLIYNILLNGDWKRQDFYKPTPEEVSYAALYEWIQDKGFNASLSGSFRKYDFTGLFNDCPVPTLICEGKHDLTWSEEKAAILRGNHPNAEYLLFENSGHSIFHDEPMLFFRKLRTFCGGLNAVQEEDLETWKTEIAAVLGPQEELIRNDAEFISILNNEGLDKALAFYRDKKASHDRVMTENGLNSLAYRFLQGEDLQTAIVLFTLNVEAYPDSWNVYDSLGEAFLAAGNKEKAIENYERSIALNPKNENGIAILEKLLAPDEQAGGKDI